MAKLLCRFGPDFWTVLYIANTAHLHNHTISICSIILLLITGIANLVLKYICKFTLSQPQSTTTTWLHLSLHVCLIAIPKCTQYTTKMKLCLWECLRVVRPEPQGGKITQLTQLMWWPSGAPASAGETSLRTRRSGESLRSTGEWKHQTLKCQHLVSISLHNAWEYQ